MARTCEYSQPFCLQHLSDQSSPWLSWWYRAHRYALLRFGREADLMLLVQHGYGRHDEPACLRSCVPNSTLPQSIEQTVRVCELVRTLHLFDHGIVVVAEVSSQQCLMHRVPGRLLPVTSDVQVPSTATTILVNVFAGKCVILSTASASIKPRPHI